ncbi:MAG TPA: shikimate dehydrogenase, partial [Vampirovibrionales bacterium]
MIYNLALLGNPVEHSNSPEIHSQFLKATNRKGSYSLIKIETPELHDSIQRLRKLGFCGVNLTIPHKQEALKVATQISQEAKLIGATNTLKFVDNGEIFADNTDWLGFRDSIWTAKWENTKEATIVGVGGSARAVMLALLKQDVENINLLIRETPSSFQNSEDLKNMVVALEKRCKIKVELLNEPEKVKLLIKNTDLLINTTPVGMHGISEGQSPISKGLIETIQNRNCLVYDLIYNPAETELLQLANKQ